MYSHLKNSSLVKLLKTLFNLPTQQATKSDSYSEYEPRCTEHVRSAIQRAKEIALELHQDFGGEHVLLAMIQRREGIAVAVLQNLDINFKRMQRFIESMSQSDSRIPTSKKELGTIFSLAAQEGKSLGHHYIGTEHLLLALIRYEPGHASSALLNMGLTADWLREEICKLLGHGNVP